MSLATWDAGYGRRLDFVVQTQSDQMEHQYMLMAKMQKFARMLITVLEEAIVGRCSALPGIIERDALEIGSGVGERSSTGSCKNTCEHK